MDMVMVMGMAAKKTESKAKAEAWVQRPTRFRKSLDRELVKEAGRRQQEIGKPVAINSLISEYVARCLAQDRKGKK